MSNAESVRARLAEACLELLRIQSPTGQEDEIVKHLKRWALAQRHLGRDDIVRSENALIIGTPDVRRPCIALVGHTDTIPPHEGEPPPRIEADNVIGPGASDMKGAIAVMQVLVETLDLDSLPFALMLVLYDREEGPYRESGLAPLLERFDVLSSIDLAVAMEPTDLTMQLGCMGSLHARVTFNGKAAHSARPWQGENAIHKAGPMLLALAQRQPRDVEVEGLVFREALSATMARGGHAANTVPDRFEVNLNYRFAPSPPLDEAEARAMREIQKVAAGADIQVVDLAPAGPVPVDNPILDHFIEHGQLDVAAKQAWTDVARLAAHGIDAVNFGPGLTSQAHQRGEYVPLSALVRAYETLSLVLSTPLEGM